MSYGNTVKISPKQSCPFNYHFGFRGLGNLIPLLLGGLVCVFGFALAGFFAGFLCDMFLAPYNCATSF